MTVITSFVPALLEKWEYDAVTHTWTFHLRDGLKFHDGKDYFGGC